MCDHPRLQTALALHTLCDGIDDIDGKSTAERIEWASAVLDAVHQSMIDDLRAKLAVLEADVARLQSQHAAAKEA